MNQILNVLSNKGSKYAVSGGQASDELMVKSLLKTMLAKKKFAKATHNT